MTASDATVANATVSYLRTRALFLRALGVVYLATDAHLLCGFGAEGESVVILLGRVTSAGTTLSVQHFQVQYVDV